MQENMEQVETLECLRGKLNALIETHSDLLEPEIMSVSQRLDQIINTYAERAKTPQK